MITAISPLRITLGGGGTDLRSYYSRYGGFVLSAAIDKYVYIGINRPAVDNLIRVKYSKSEITTSLDDIQHPLVREALRLTGIRENVEIVAMADIPAGTGLGSSAAFTVALLKGLHACKQEDISSHDLAEEACEVEIEMAGQPVGKQDQYMAAFGGVRCLQISEDGTVEATPLVASGQSLEELKSRLLLFYTGMQRSDMRILDKQNRDTIADKRDVMASLHETKTIGLQVKEALERGDFDAFGRLLDRHWQIKKERSGDISNDAIDRWYELAMKCGALGGKLVGAGGGGFLMIYCPHQRQAEVRYALTGVGLRALEYSFDHEGAKVIANL